MYLEITDATAIVFMIFLSIVVVFFSTLFLKSIKKEKVRYKEEKAISIEGLLSKSAINSQISSYLGKISLDTNFSLMLLEFQKYDDIVDAFGKKEAERTIEKVIYKVLYELPKRVQIASYGGTRFLIFLKSEYDRFYSIDLAKKIIAAASKPIKIYRDTSINLVSNIGISYYPKHGRKFKKLMNSLDIALHNAIKAGDNKYVIYSSSMRSEFKDDLEYHFEIKEAIEKKEFIMEYQPIIHINNNEIYGFEAFVRWDHPKHGVLSPVQFLNIMEQSGDISWIGNWGLETIIEKYYELSRSCDNRQFEFTINVSPRQLFDDNIVENFGKLLKKYKMEASIISLEISEYSTYEKNTVIKSNINRLKKLGFKIAINGFGLDYSTLTDLESMPIDTIRLDKQFFEKDKESYMKDKLTSLIVDYAKNNNKIVIAEGVESEELLTMIKDLEINLVQGFVFSSPIKSTKVEGFINRRGWENKEQMVLEDTIKNQEELIVTRLVEEPVLIRRVEENIVATNTIDPVLEEVEVPIEQQAEEFSTNQVEEPFEQQAEELANNEVEEPFDQQAEELATNQVEEPVVEDQREETIEVEQIEQESIEEKESEKPAKADNFDDDMDFI